MKKFSLIFCSIFTFCAFAIDADFTFKPNLSGWKKNNRAVYFDKTEKVSGKGSLKLVNTASVSKVIQLEPGAEYEISVYIKAQNVKGGKNKGVLLRLTDGSKYFAVTGHPRHLPQQGSFDWTRCTRRLKSSFFKKSTVTVMPVLTCKGTVWFDDLKIVKLSGSRGHFRKAYGSTVKKAVLVPGGTFGFFQPGEKVSMNFHLDTAAKNLSYTLAVKDESGKNVYRTPRKKLTKTISIPGQESGYYIVDTEIFSGSKKVYDLQSAFAVNRPVKKLDPFFQFSYGATPDILKGIKRVGGGTITLKYRLGHPIHKVYTPEQYAERFFKANKAFLDDPDLTLRIAVGCSIGRNHRSKAEFEAGFPLLSDKALQHLLDTVGIIHSRTKTRVREWGVGCEIPSNAHGGSKKTLCGTWTEAMFNMLVATRMVSRKLKSADPDIHIVCGGNNRQECTETIERIVMSDLIKDFDEYAIDAYTGNWNMTLGQHSIPELNLMKFYQTASKLSDSLGKGKRIRNNETGYAINYGARFDQGLAVEQAYLTARTIIITRFAPVNCFELHMPTYRHRNLRNPKDSSVCMTTIWKPFYFNKKWYDIPLPGGAMYAVAAEELSYAKSLAEVKNGSVYCYLFQKPDGSVLITLWNIAENQKFTWNFPGNASAVNMYGRKISVKNLEIGKAPVYITVKMPPAKAVEMMKKAVVQNAPEFKCFAYPDKVFISSSAATVRECRLQLPGVKERKIRIMPGRMNEVKAKVSGNGKLTAPDGRTYDIPLVKMDFHTVSRLKKRPVFDGSGKWLASLKSGLLKYPDHIRPMEALQPERRYFRTSSYNPDGHNISARYWTAYDDEYFYLAVKVDDPVHQQRQQALELWRDDCVQFVFSHVGGSVAAMPGQIPRSQHNYGLALTKNGTQLVKFRGKDRGLKSYPAKVTRKGNTTFYEAAVPWKAMGGKAARFGFVVFNNNWQTRSYAPYHLDFSAGIAGGLDDTKLKVLKYAR